MTTLRGVNLGGWLIIEKWMTPSLFESIDASNEFELSKSNEGRERISKHHARFIQKKDLLWIKQNGIEIIRVPVGHWIFGGDSRYVGAIDRLDWLMEASLSLGIKVLLDLHAAPGAQNRSEHSGSGNTVSNIRSTKWLNDASAQEKTIEVLERLAERYHDFPHLWGIELLNEPSVDLLGLKLVRFYRNGYRRLIKVARPGTRIVFSDGYAPLRLTNCLWLMTKRDFPVIMDCHVYQIFGEHNKRRSFDGHIRRLAWTKRLLRFLRLQQPVIIGEWSAMLPFKATSEQTRSFIDAQYRTFEQTQAHFFWNYKTEPLGRWNYRDLVESKLLQ